jgi:hypothetical protein
VTVLVAKFWKFYWYPCDAPSTNAGDVEPLEYDSTANCKGAALEGTVIYELYSSAASSDSRLHFYTDTFLLYNA